MGVRSGRGLVGAAFVVALLGAATAWAQTAPVASAATYSESAEVLASTLRCHGDLARSRQAPVLLVHGTAVDPSQFGWNWMRSLDDSGTPWCSVDLFRNAMGDIQISGERVAYAIRTMHAQAGRRRIDVIGHSQGGMVPRWALRFFPDTRAMVDDVIGLAASNHGTLVAGSFCAPDCAPAIWQQRAGSRFMAALNEGAETWAGISYTNIYTWADEFVQPNLDDSGSTSLHTGKGRITNVAVQDVCPLAVVDHLTVGTSDATAHALARDALAHDGPANPRRIDGSTCLRPMMPATDLAATGVGLTEAGVQIVQSLATAAKVPAEPPLRCYVRSTC